MLQKIPKSKFGAMYIFMRRTIIAQTKTVNAITTQAVTIPVHFDEILISKPLRYAYLAARNIAAAKPRITNLSVTFIAASIESILTDIRTKIGIVFSLSTRLATAV